MFNPGINSTLIPRIADAHVVDHIVVDMVAAGTATDKDSASVLVEDRIVDNILIAGVAVYPRLPAGATGGAMV